MCGVGTTLLVNLVVVEACQGFQIASSAGKNSLNSRDPIALLP